MGNTAVERFFANYNLLQESFETFAREQSKLLSSDLVTVSTDYRGTLTYKGVEGFFEALKEWSECFGVGPDFRTEMVQATTRHALVRLHGDLNLLKPVNGKSVSKNGDFDWTEEFELSEDGLITKLDVKLTLHV
jgi:hypothetical protein